MITEAVMSFFVALVDFVLSLFPDDAPPGWLSDGSGLLADVWTQAAGLGAWIPWSLVGTVLGAVLTCVGVGFVIKAVRIVASFLLAGGGAAG